MSSDSSFLLEDSDPLLDPHAFSSPSTSSGGSRVGGGLNYNTDGDDSYRPESTPISHPSPSTFSAKKIAYAVGLTALVGLVAVASLSSHHDIAQPVGSTANSNMNLFGNTNLADSNADLEIIPPKKRTSAEEKVALKVKDMHVLEIS